VRSDEHNRAIDKLLVLAVPVAIFVYASTRPISRLKPEMPAEFVEAPRYATARQRTAEERIAQAYWNCAVSLIQWRYTYGSRLPDDPPPDAFQIGALDPTGSSLRESSRLRYWRKLQKLWNSPDAWTTSREWSTHWLTDPVRNGIEDFREYFSDLIHTG
jgi:hypothetical protein